jgi:hypothetical protein
MRWMIDGIMERVNYLSYVYITCTWRSDIRETDEIKISILDLVNHTRFM